MTHHGTNPHAEQWADARATVAKLIEQVEQTLLTVGSARHNLNWRGGSERYFQWQAGRQHHYLTNQLNYLHELRGWLEQAAHHPGEIKLNPLVGSPS